MRISILPKTPLGKWSIGFFVALIIIYISILILEGVFGMAEPKSVTRTILATALAISSIGSIVTGFIGVLRKRPIFFVPLLIGIFVLIQSLGFMFTWG